MTDFSSDAVSGVFPRRSLYYQTNRISLVDPASVVGEQNNLPDEVKKQISSSVTYNIALVGLSFVKILTSAAVLGFTSQIYKPFADIAFYMIVHDVSYILSLLMKIRTIINGIFALVPENNPDVDFDRHSISRERFLNFNSQGQSGSGEFIFHISDEVEKKNQTVKIMSNISKAVYYILFAYGQIIYFHYYPTCQEDIETPIKNLVVFYIVSGYIYIGLPILFLVGLGLYLPFLFVWMYLDPKGDQSPVSNSDLKKLSVISYLNPLPGNNECSICIADYKKGDKIIQLQCSPMHHFHEGCLKKWLKINGLCPVCRHSIVNKPKEKSHID